jgi:hypothetical protein
MGNNERGISMAIAIMREGKTPVSERIRKVIRIQASVWSSRKKFM